MAETSPRQRRPRPKPRASGGERSWTDAESDAAFDEFGDRIIDGVRRFQRSERRLRLRADLYTVDGRELTLAQVDALEAIAQGDIRMNELASRLGVEPSTATRTVAPLVDLGLVERLTDPGNRRHVVMRCTQTGRETAKRLSDQRRDLMREILTPMDPQRRLILADVLEEYISLIEQPRAK